MKKILFLVPFILFGCSSTTSGTNSNKNTGHTRTKDVVLLNDNTYLITETTSDKTYGYSPSNGVKVGELSPKNERRFLNGLLGPNGEELQYYRVGSCCSFKTPNAMVGNVGMMDHYKVYWEGVKDTLSIYINMYDKGDLKIPVGLTAKTR